MMGDLSKNFNRLEFACKCGCGLDGIYLPTVHALQKLRDLLGQPVRITGSGCRCRAHNRAVGGATDSQHLPAKDRLNPMGGKDCTAADITVKTLTPAELADFIEDNIPEFANGGIGRYAGFVHVDLGPKRRW